MKKGQMEIMGLVIVLILLTLGVLFVIRFVVLEDDDSIRQQHAESQMAANLLNSMLQTSATDCNNQQIKSLFRDCAMGNTIECDDGNKSCKFLNKTVEDILNRTLGEWNRDYYFNASGGKLGDPGRKLDFGAECPSSYDSKFYPIQAGTDTVKVLLQICT